MPEIRDISDHQRLGLLNLRKFGAERGITSGRECETLGTRFLVDRLLNGIPCNILYTEFRKPYLEGRDEKISVSHSHDRLVVFMNTREETGVDIELLRDKVLNIRHKFLSESEKHFAGDDIETLISIWAAKEAMYKVYGRKQLDFRRHLKVDPFPGDDLYGTLVTGDVRHDYAMRRERLGEYILVYILNEIPVAERQTS